MTSTTTSAWAIERRASSTLSDSTAPPRATRPALRMPAVSTMRTFLRCQARTLSTGSRVVPGTSDTIIRSSRNRRLTSDDFPALGRPTMATASSAGACPPWRSSSSVGAAASGDARAGSRRIDLVHQVADTPSVLGAHLDHGIEAQAIEVERSGFGALVVGLVDGQQHRPAGAAGGPGNLLVAGDQAGPAVDHEDDEIGGLEGAATGVDDQFVQGVGAVAEHAAGVGQHEGRRRPPAPGGPGSPAWSRARGSRWRAGCPSSC